MKNLCLIFCYIFTSNLIASEKPLKKHSFKCNGQIEHAADGSLGCLESGLSRFEKSNKGWVSPPTANQQNYAHRHIGEDMETSIFDLQCISDRLWLYERVRYVTYYDKRSKKVQQGRKVKEECHDNYRFFEYSTQFTSEITVTTEVGLDELGFSVGHRYGQRITYKRNLNGRDGEEALHIPYITKVNYGGFTIAQYYDEDTGNTFTCYGDDEYENFFVRDAEYIMSVKRTNVDSRNCSEYFF